MSRTYWTLVITFAMMVLGGCADKPVALLPLSEADLAELTAATNFPHGDYRLEPGDAIQIRYLHHPEMAQDDVIPLDSRIALKLVGEVDVSGMTVDELEQFLAKKTSEHLENPEVVVSVTRFSEKRVYVGGEVARPGIVPYRRGLTPLQAVVASGGFRDTARLDSVILLRAGGSEDEIVARKLNLEQVVRKGEQEPIPLAPHDVIFVPRSEVADANAWVRQHITDMVRLSRGVGDFWLPGELEAMLGHR